MIRRSMVFFGLALSAAACGYDWQIGEPATGGAGGESTSSGGSGGTGSGGTGSGGAGGSAADCTALLADVVATKADAKACVQAMPAHCADSVKDECGCNSFVKQSASAETAAFVAAVAAASDAGCKASCSGCSGPVLGSCIPGSGGGTSCYP